MSPISNSPEDLAYNVCRITSHDRSNEICPRCGRRIMPALRSAATKQISLLYNDYDGSINITVNGGYSTIMQKAEAKTVGKLLLEMADADD